MKQQSPTFEVPALENPIEVIAANDIMDEEPPSKIDILVDADISNIDIAQENRELVSDAEPEQPPQVPTTVPNLDTNNQFMYTHMLQQQVNALQSQLLQLTTSIASSNQQMMMNPYHFQMTIPSRNSRKVTLDVFTQTDEIIIPNREIQIQTMPLGCNSVACNTSFIIPNQDEVSNDTITNQANYKVPYPTLKTESIFDAKTAPTESVMFSGFSDGLKLTTASLFHPPTDHGDNYEVVEFDQDEQQIEHAKHIIAGLVNNAEDSFYHSESEGCSISAPKTTTVFSKPKVPLAMTVTPSPLLKQSFAYSFAKDRDDHRSNTIDSEGFSGSKLDFPTEDNVSLSFATTAYLKKYGLN